MTRSPSMTIPAALLAAVLILAGCGGDDPAAPEADPVGTEVGPAGGSFEFADGLVGLDVPANALGDTIEITVDEAGSPPADEGRVPGTCFEFSPDGQTFLQPVDLCIAYDEADLPENVAETSLRLCKAVDGAWQEISGGTVDAAANTVTAAISSFSCYGIVGTVTAEGPVYDGDYVICDQTTLDAFAGYVGITGTLEIATQGPDTVVVADITSIDGDLKIYGSAQATHVLRSATLPALESIGGTLWVENCDSLQTLSLPACTATGYLKVTRNLVLPNLDGLGMLNSFGPVGSTFDGTILITKNSSLENVDGLAGLTGTTGTIRLDDNPLMTSVAGLGGITHVTGNFEIDDCEALTTLDGLGLRQIDDSLFIQSNGVLADLTGLDLLTSVARFLQIEYCPALTDLTGLGQLASCGLLGLQYDHGLTSLDGLGPLQQVTMSSLIISYNNSLADISALEFLTTVAANLQFENNPLLTDFTGLEALTHVGYNLWIDNMPELTDFDALSQLDHAWGHLHICDCVNLSSVEGLWGLQADPTTGYVCKSFTITGNAQALVPGGLSDAAALELLDRIGGESLVEGNVLIEGN